MNPLVVISVIFALSLVGAFVLFKLLKSEILSNVVDERGQAASS